MKAPEKGTDRLTEVTASSAGILPAIAVGGTPHNNLKPLLHPPNAFLLLLPSAYISRVSDTRGRNLF
jgi:hypothetical protein